MQPTTKTSFSFQRVAVELDGKPYVFSGSAAIVYNGRGGWRPGRITIESGAASAANTVLKPATQAHTAVAAALHAQRGEDMAEAVRRDLYEGGGYFRLFGHFPPSNPDGVDLPSRDRFGRLQLAA